MHNARKQIRLVQRNSMFTTKWRPATSIKVKALGLHWREGKLLAAEVLDDRGHLKGVRPLGGSIEFGEHWQSALIREFKEELGVDVEILGPALVMENIYTHEGEPGHEVLFICEVLFSSTNFDNQSSIEFHEDSGTQCTARWFDLAELDLPEGPALFPVGLKKALQGKHHRQSNTATGKPVCSEGAE
jgi:ADP-ribose pyrophosphatase YjhB (NUDIX family)